MPKEDDFTAAIVKMWIARALEGESQIQETREWNRETMAVGPLMQAVTAAAGLLAVFAGLSCIGAIGAWSLAEDWTWQDLLFGAALFACLGLVVLLALMVAIRRITTKASQGALLVLSCGLLALVITAALLVAARARGAFAWWQLLLTVIGFALLVPGLALTYRQLMDIFDPYGKTSPMERMLQPYLTQIFGAGQETKTVTELLPFPVHVNGTLTAAAMNAERDEQAEEPPEPVYLAPQFLDLIRLVEIAGKVGWQRDNHITRPHMLMPSGKLLTRPYFEALLEELEDRWQIVRRPGKGVTPEWRMDPDAALGILMAVLDAWQPGRQPGKLAA